MIARAMWSLLAGALILGGTVRGADDNWELVWSDEFDGPEVSDEWVFETGNGNDGWGNNELEFYQRENARIADGMLIITAKKESRDGFNYTSARLKTQGRKSWKYGRIEARIELPDFRGQWPAFWMLGDSITEIGWPRCGEIDIMENINGDRRVHGTAHWSAEDGSKAEYGGGISTTITRFHVYAIEWDEDFIRWFVDGRKYHEMRITDGVNGTSAFHEPFFIVLNLAVGGRWPGFDVENRKLPAEMRVDYVRVYQKKQ